MEREHTPRLEEKNINLEKYGYTDSTRRETRLKNILKKDGRQIVSESVNIFGPTMTAVAAKTRERSDVMKWKNGETEPTDDAKVRIGIGLDFVYQMRKEGYKTDAIARALFVGMKAQFNDKAMLTALHEVDSKDLALVHAAFDEIINDERYGVFYTAQTIYPGLEKYFLPPRAQEIYKKK